MWLLQDFRGETAMGGEGAPTAQPLLPLGIWKILRNCGRQRNGRILDGVPKVL